ncbi:MAG: hypothetical protein ABR502_05045 [Chitinophagaceae bacterium]
MLKLSFIFLFVCLLVINTSAQKEKAIKNADVDYEELFSELDDLLDSLAAPRTMFMINFGIGSGYYNYNSRTVASLSTNKRVIFNPSAAYLHKSGFGVSGGSSIINGGSGLNAYQFSLSGSYDYLKSSNIITGASFTHFFTKDSLSFYTTPLENEMYAYITQKNWWVKPALSVSYGWGSRSGYREREKLVRSMRLKHAVPISRTTKENISDFSLATSVRHDFYWLNVLLKSDFLRLTPQVTFTSGTQNFGFNQSSTYITNNNRYKGSSVLYNSENVHLDDRLNFQPLSVAAYIKTEFSTGKFYIQPQVMFDYYFPATENRFSKNFYLNTGIVF